MKLSLIGWFLFICAPLIIVSSLETKSHASSSSRDKECPQTGISREEMDNKDKSRDENSNHLEFGVENRAQSTFESENKKVRVNNDEVGKRSKPPLNRLLGRQLPGQCPYPRNCDPNAIYRTFDGTCNNYNNLGQAGSCHRRILAADYDDGVSAPKTRGNTLPNPRDVCIAVHRTPPPSYDSNSTTFSSMYMAYGQFIDHDLTFTPVMTQANNVPFRCCPISGANREACFPISLGNNDPDFSNDCMNFSRSLECVQSSVRARQQRNSLTAFMDCSHIYGLTEDQANLLRSRIDGKLATQLVQGEQLLPPDNTTQCSCPAQCCPFRTGDTRANQNALLTLLHTVFVRFHNVVATLFKSSFQNWNDEKLYQEARKFVIACFQHICYNYYLPVLLGYRDMNYFHLYDNDTVYDCNQDPRTINECMAAAFRLHSTVPNTFLCSTAGQNSAFPLGGNFFNVSRFYVGGNVNCLASGSFRQPQQSFDPLLAPSVNRFLYLRTNNAPPVLDLCSINIQRGRDHGLPSYPAYVEFCLGIKLQSFDHLEYVGLLFPECVQQYRRMYNSVNDIDLWSAMQCETDTKGALLGPVSRCIVGIQFYGTKYGDRFFWTHKENVSLTNTQKAIIFNMTLEKIFCNTSNMSEIAQNVFALKSNSISCKDQKMKMPDLSKWET